MSKVTYDYLFDDEPLFPTYVQLQMADQSIWFLEGIAKDIMVRIQDNYVPTDFMILDMEEEEEDVLSSLEDHSSTPPTRSSTSDLDKSTSNSLNKRYVAISIVIQLMNSQRRPAPRGDADQPNARGINPQRMRKRKQTLEKMNRLCRKQVL